MKRQIKGNAPTFQDFWDAYGLKRDRMAAERAFMRLSAQDRIAAFKGITAYRADCQQRGVHMMYAQGYLTHRRWEDEVESLSEPVSSHDARKPQPSPTQPEMDMW